MRTYRTTRPRTRLLAATGMALAALALTACQDGTDTKNDGASQPATTSASPSPTAKETGAADKGTASTGSTSGGSGSTKGKGTAAGSGTNGTTGGSGTSGGSGKSSGKGDATDPWDPANRVLCNGSNTTVTVQPVSRPLNHMLITVKNTGSKYCDLTYYPVLRFDEMQWAPRPMESSHPQAVTTLAPGESGYAGVLLSAADGSGDGGTTGHKLAVNFQGVTPNSEGGPAATPKLPAKGLYYDSTLTPTYWLRDQDEALSY